MYLCSGRCDKGTTTIAHMQTTAQHYVTGMSRCTLVCVSIFYGFCIFTKRKNTELHQHNLSV